MTKLDLRKEWKHLYQPSAKAPVVVEVPGFQFLMIDGRGGPNDGVEFQAAVEALYGMAYTLKFAAKMGPLQVDYPVMALEGLWWTEPEMTRLPDFLNPDRSGWRWTLMIMQPDLVTEEMAAEAREKVRKKRGSAALERVRLGRFGEGTAVQIMHIGPYAEELPTLEKLHAFAQGQGYALRGKHHEIYMSDPRRAAPEKMKTVLRQPVE